MWMSKQFISCLIFGGDLRDQMVKFYEAFFVGTWCRWTRVRRRNCGRKTQKGKMIIRSAERVRRGRNCVKKLQDAKPFWFCVWGPLRGPENSVDPMQNIRRTCGPADPSYTSGSSDGTKTFCVIGGPNQLFSYTSGSSDSTKTFCVVRGPNQLISYTSGSSDGTKPFCVVGGPGTKTFCVVRGPNELSY